MLPIANVHLKDLYDTTLQFIAYHIPAISLRAQPKEEEHVSSDSRAPTPACTTHLDSEAQLQATTYGASLRERLYLSVSGRHSTCTARPLGLSPTTPMRRELDVTKHELSRSQSEVNKLQERCKMLERTLKETKEILQMRDAEIERLKREKEKDRIQADRRRSAELQQQAHALTRAAAAREVRQIQSHTSLRSNGTNGHVRRSSAESVTHSTTSSEEERARIRSAEMYLTRTDNWSGAQVLQAVHDLNSEILQFAASATEICSFDKDARSSSMRSVSALQDTSARLGPSLARILSNRDHSQDPILVQLALQGCISTCIARALSSFCMGYPSKSDSVLSLIYAHMALAGTFASLIMKSFQA